MGSLYENEITKFVDKHLLLIEEERKEECDQSQKSIQSYHYGVCVKNLSLSSITSCLGGYVLAEFRSAKSLVLPAHNLCHNDVVGIVEGTDLQVTPIATGVVKFTKDEIIAVSFEDVTFDEEDALYSLVKLANDITYSRLKLSLKGLVHINKHPGRILAELIFGKDNNLEQITLPSSILDGSGEIKFINCNLHSDQKLAVKFALKMKNLAVIHGPPGTGKTTTLIEIILQMVKMENKLLVCAPSNVAVDNLVEKLSLYSIKMVRLGHPARIMENISHYSLDAVVDASSSSQIVRDVRKELNDNLNKLKSKRYKESRHEIYKELKNLRKELQERESRALKEILRGADIILSTLITASENGPLKHLPEEHFNCVIIDECSQALEAACWIVLPRATKVVLAGDHLQLPPTVLSKNAEQEGLGLSLMERVVNKFGNDVYRLLKRQFRMHNDIMKWPSNEMYGGQLEADPSVASHLLKDLPSVETTDETELSLLFVDTADGQFEEEDNDSSRCNRGEAGIISVLVKRLVAANVPQTSVAVITPYNYQVEMIKSYISDLKGVEVRSIDGFQGREKEAILLSLVRSNPERKLGFITDRRRLNVAVSRARRFLCVVADSRTVSHDDTVASLIDYISQNGEVHVAEQYISYIDIPNKVIQNKKFQSTGKTKKGMKGEPFLNSKNKNKPKVQASVKENTDKLQKTQEKKETSVGEEVDHWGAIIHKFSISNQTELKFSNTVSAYDRRLIHEAAEKLGLNHVSKGEGSERYTVVSKPSNNKLENLNKTKQNSVIKPVSSINTEIASSVSGGRVKSKSSANPSKEDTLKTKQHNALTEDSVTSESDSHPKERLTVEKTEQKKTEKVNKKSRKEEPEDFESLIAQFQEMDKRCPWSNCKVPTDLVGLSCPHCKRRFCLTHGLPELHGCGEDARRLAKQQFKHPLPSKPDPLKRNAASRKLEKKLQQMADERKPRKKETDKK